MLKYTIMSEHGYIYILTNPAFPQYVKIGYATDVEKRLKSLNGPSVPFAFRVYATYRVNKKLGDIMVHKMISKINPSLRAVDTTGNSHSRSSEFFDMSAEDAYMIFEAMAQLHGTEKNLKLWKASEAEKQDEETAKETQPNQNPFYEEFWTVFEKEAIKYPGFRDEISLRKISTRPYTDLASGTSGIRVTLFIRTREKNIGGGIYFAGNKELYQAFYKHRAKINRQIREALPQGSIRWTERAKDCTIRHFLDADVKSTPKKDWPKFARQLCQEALLMKQIIQQNLP